MSKIDFISEFIPANNIIGIDLVQNLWSGYGQLLRVKLEKMPFSSLIVKQIKTEIIQHHPHGWDTTTSHQRKIKSYEVEMEWYKNYAQQCNTSCRVANLIHLEQNKDFTRIYLEDLNQSGFSERRQQLKLDEALVVLKWLAHFHVKFLHHQPVKLWSTGTYWHFATRQDEYVRMENSVLKEMAPLLDQTLASCKYKTIVHGDAKVANFCFNKDFRKVAAVDFQYVGGGCGMKDVAYFLGSCLSENQCIQHESKLLDYYFTQFRVALTTSHSSLEMDELENEWRRMYPIAWADFARFLKGWSPNHQKLNGYVSKMVKQAIANI